MTFNRKLGRHKLQSLKFRRKPEGQPRAKKWMVEDRAMYLAIVKRGNLNFPAIVKSQKNKDERF